MTDVIIVPMRSETEMIDQGAIYHFNHQVSQIPRSEGLPDVRNRLSISSSAIDIRRDLDEPMKFVMADPRQRLGRCP